MLEKCIPMHCFIRFEPHTFDAYGWGMYVHMKKLIALMALAGASVAPVAYAAPSIEVIGSPEVFVVENPACDELIFTWNIEVTGDEKAYEVTKEAGFEFNGETVGSYNVPVTSGVTAVEASNDNPCAFEARYDVYSDDFRVDPQEVENFTVKAFFTPEEAGDVTVNIFGMELLEVEEQTTPTTPTTTQSGGHGKCLNCSTSNEEEEVEEEEVLGITIDDEGFDTDTRVILEFIQLLITLGIIDLS